MRIKSVLTKSHFVKNVLVLMTGTGLAQIISLLLSPVISRIFEPNDFGVFAIFTSIVSILGIFATARFEMAIMLPREDSEVSKIISLICSTTLFVCIISMLVFIFLNTEIVKQLESPYIGRWLYFIPFALALNSLYQVLNYVLIRFKSFKRLASNKVIHSSITSAGQLMLGFSKFGPGGLILPNLLAFIVSCMLILKEQKIKSLFLGIRLNTDFKSTFSKYRQFPLFDVPAMVLNLGASQLPIFALGKLFSVASVGYYAFTFKILTTPLNLLSNTVLDVFKQKATEDYNSTGACRGIFLKTLLSLTLLAIIPFAILGLFGPQIFGFIFGEKWEISGVYSQIMAPMFFFKFIASPLSYVFTIRNKQNYNLIGQIILTCLIILSFIIGKIYDDEKIALTFFSLFYVLIYIGYLIVSYKLSKGVKKNEELSKEN